MEQIVSITSYYISSNAAFLNLGGISLTDFKKDVVLVGGSEDGHASLLRDDIDPDLDLRYSNYSFNSWRSKFSH